MFWQADRFSGGKTPRGKVTCTDRRWGAHQGFLEVEGVHEAGLEAGQLISAPHALHEQVHLPQGRQLQALGAVLAGLAGPGRVLEGCTGQPLQGGLCADGLSGRLCVGVAVRSVLHSMRAKLCRGRGLPCSVGGIISSPAHRAELRVGVRVAGKGPATALGLVTGLCIPLQATEWLCAACKLAVCAAVTAHMNV